LAVPTAAGLASVTVKAARQASGYVARSRPGEPMGGKHEVPGTDMFMAVVIFALIAVLGIVITLALLGVGG
jgi:hypothetical protein